MITKSNKILWIFVSVFVALVVGFLCVMPKSQSIRIEQQIRTIELKNSQIEYSTLLNGFDKVEWDVNGSTTLLTAYQTVDASLFAEVDEINAKDLQQIKYEFSYDSKTNIVKLSAVAESEVIIDIIYGSAFINEVGEIDAIFCLSAEDEEYITLSEMQQRGLVENCGLFSWIIKAVVTVAAVAVCVATAGAGVAACIAVGAAVAATSSVAEQLVDTGTVDLTTTLVDTALGAVTGGAGGAIGNAAKTAAKTTAKAVTKEAAKKVTKEVSENYSNVVNKNLIKFLKEEKVSSTQLKQRVDYLPSSNNQNGWRIVGNDGKSLTKNELVNTGGNGTITRVENGTSVEYADIVQGTIVFRETQIKGVTKLDTQFVKDRAVNFKNLDTNFAREVANPKNTSQNLQEVRNWCKTNLNRNITTIDKDAIRQYREALDLTWHETSDCMTGQLVKSEIHSVAKGGVPHVGGISELG